MLTNDEIMLVRTTWAKVEPIAETAAGLFYGRLFELDPNLQILFTGDMTEQGKKLMKMIGVAVAHLDRLGEVVPAVQALGKRHVGYGVKDEHYDTVAVALLWTLEKGLGNDFTPAAKDAWTKTYTILADTMKTAAAEAA